ncbi:hypothetical protein ACROYT_G010679 [Oculina patagonica]
MAASQGRLVGFRGLHSARCLLRTTNISTAKRIGAKDCRRTFMTSILRQAVPTTQILMPALSPTMEEGTIIKWMKKEGDFVSPGDVLCEIETDKATISMDSDEEGILAKIIVPEGTTNIKISQLIALMVEEGEDYTKVEVPLDAEIHKETENSATAVESSSAHGNGDVLMSPAVRVLLETYQLNPRLIQATGPKGRLLKGDVLRYVAQGGKPFTKPGEEASPEAKVATKAAPSQQTKPATDTTVSKPKPAISSTLPSDAVVGPGYTDVPHTNMRRTIAKRLTESKATVPHTYATTNCIMNNLLELRKGLDVKVSVNDFIIKAAALSLRQVPEMNAVWSGEDAQLLREVDISVAVATDTGLITPIVKTADNLKLAEISSTLKDLASRAREGKLQLHEFQGGSFTISNLGMFGIKEFSAVINPPQACIMAVGGSRPVLTADETIQSIMTVTLSCDRRMVDDELAARWLDAFKSNIENPSRLLV